MARPEQCRPHSGGRQPQRPAPRPPAPARAAAGANARGVHRDQGPDLWPGAHEGQGEKGRARANPRVNARRTAHADQGPNPSGTPPDP
eukprot:6064618-Alexandrium_andersonii.AAC.1